MTDHSDIYNFKIQDIFGAFIGTDEVMALYQESDANYPADLLDTSAQQFEAWEHEKLAWMLKFFGAGTNEQSFLFKKWVRQYPDHNILKARRKFARQFSNYFTSQVMPQSKRLTSIKDLYVESVAPDQLEFSTNPAVRARQRQTQQTHVDFMIVLEQVTHVQIKLDGAHFLKTARYIDAEMTKAKAAERAANPEIYEAAEAVTDWLFGDDD